MCPEEKNFIRADLPGKETNMLSELFHIDKIMEICEKVMYFLKVNTLFLLCNLPVLLFFLFVGIGSVREYLPFFLLCLIPVGPAFSAVLFAMNRMLHGTETGAWKDFSAGYRDDFLRKLLLAAVQAVLLWVFWTNVEFFSLQRPFLPLMVLFVLLFTGTVLMTPNLYLLASRYQMSVKDWLKGAALITVTKPALTFGNLAAAVFILMLLEIRAGTVVLFMSSVYGFLIVFMNRKVIRALDEKARGR